MAASRKTATIVTLLLCVVLLCAAAVIWKMPSKASTEPSETAAPAATTAANTPTPTPTPVDDGNGGAIIPIEGNEPHYYAKDPKDAQYYFGPNAYVEAQEKLEAEPEGSNATVATEASDIFFDRMIGEKPDPALAAAVAYYLDVKGLSKDKPILLPNENPNDAAARFVEDRAAWEKAVSRIYNILHGEGLVSVSVEEVGDYTSAMFMVVEYDPKTGEPTDAIPEIIVRDTEGETGHLLVFRFRLEKDGEIILVRFRLECGYQPVDVPPELPPPRRRPTPTPTPTATPTPTVTPTPKPKDRTKDPVVRNTDPSVAADIGSPSDPANHDQNRDKTPEPTSPSSFNNVVTPTPTSSPTATPTARPTTAPRASTPTPTPRPTATPTRRPTATPTPAVERALQNDGVNVGDVNYGDPDDK